MATRPNKGILTDWKDDRGFGFIQPDDGSAKVFLHISAVRQTHRRPKAGDIILYEPTLQSDGRYRAVNASIDGLPLQPKLKPTTALPQKNQIPRRRKQSNDWVVGLLLLAAVATGLVFSGTFKRSAIPSSLDTDSIPSTPQNAILSAVNPNCVIKGNISYNSGRKWYHMPGMEDYERTRIDLGSGERWFCTEQEAIAAGWQKAPPQAGDR